ncbi:MAG: peptide chain release factor N(5)-glutamine methyltransferase [Clostridia bacterium]|nr:peptide chain release factor N(5)-glutamine methyltransferase [Clostridia bacterium]
MTLREAIATLTEAGIDSAEHDARALFRHFLGNNEGYIPKDTDCTSDALVNAVKRRQEREPLQYIIGRVGFYREEYLVTDAVLIPRPDTEHLVEYAVKHIPRGECFLDVCTGSGCIAVSTLKNTADTTATAVDISRDALSVAKKNAELNGVSDRITLLERDILKSPYTGGEKFYALLSNPPYVSHEAYASLEPEIYKEPRIAFVGGEDGGDFYRALIPMAKNIVKPEGFIAFEIGYDQRELLCSLSEREDMDIEIIRDYSGNDRVAVLRFRRASKNG